MSSASTKFSQIEQKLPNLSLGTLCKCIAISGLVLFLFYTFLYGNQPYSQSLHLFMPFEKKWPDSSPNITNNSPTNLSHIMFVLSGSIKTWTHRKSYIEAWWRPNMTRGNLWLDFHPPKEFLPWPSSSPPFRVNEDVTKLKGYSRFANPVQIRMYYSILETYRLVDNKDVRWYVMIDDDTLVFVDNLVEVLGNYDHNKYYYIGTNSECIGSNAVFSFDMGYGGAGYAVSYPLVETLASKIEDCIRRYQHLLVSDYISHSCLADLGVDLTIEKGHHQIDLIGDVSGLLSSHPNSPIITLHHFDTIDPLFPSKNRSESINHLMRAGKIDQSRMFQQSICYHREANWTFSISWGYAINIYENIFPRSILRKPLETFRPWKKGRPPFFMFNTRWMTNNPCESPHEFTLDTITTNKVQVVTNYTRRSPRNLPPCASAGNHSADHIFNVRVFSPSTRRKEAKRIECCDVAYMAGKDTVDVNLRACVKRETLA